MAKGFRPPVQQFRVRVGRRTFKIDLAYPVVRLTIELDGWGFHGTRSAFDDDRTRATLLVANGWAGVRFTLDRRGDRRLRRPVWSIGGGIASPIDQTVGGTA